MTTAYTTPTTQSALHVVTTTEWNRDLVDNVRYLGEDGPRLRVNRSSTLSIGSGSSTAITWNAEDYDTDTMHDLGANTSRLVATHAGKYRLTAYCEFATNTTGLRYVAVSKNGTGQLAASPILVTASLGSNVAPMPVAWVGELAAADYLEISAFQDSGGNLNITTNSWAALEWTGKHS